MTNRKTKDILKAARKVDCKPKKHKSTSHQHWKCPKGDFGIVVNKKHIKEQSIGVAKKAWKVIEDNQNGQ